MKLNCQSVSSSEAGDEIFQIVFNAVINLDDGPCLLLQRAFLEDFNRISFSWEWKE